MLYSRQTRGPVPEVVERLIKAVKDHQFGVLGEIDLRAKMNEKGVPFEHDCIILEVCNPSQAKKVLDQNLAISTSLPCRISIYEKDGKVTVATVKPTILLKMYQDAEDLAPVAKDVENTLIAIINQACQKDPISPSGTVPS